MQVRLALKTFHTFFFFHVGGKKKKKKNTMAFLLLKVTGWFRCQIRNDLLSHIFSRQFKQERSAFKKQGHQPTLASI